MSFGRNHHSQGSTLHDDRWSSFNRNNYNSKNRNANLPRSNSYNHNWNYNHEYPGKFRDHINNNYINPTNGAPSLKRRKFSSGSWGAVGTHFLHPTMYESAVSSTYNHSAPPTRSNAEVSTSISCKRDRSQLDEDEPVFMSRDEIERHSPSRKDGIDVLRETYLRYSYCEFLQNLGMRLELPQTTVGTAMVLCHRFFVRRSHACHDRYLIATAALFLASKSEETPCPLNNVVRASCEIFHKQDMTFLSYILPVDWFEQYRERVTEAEQMILTTLNFELNVQHPYAHLTSVLEKLGFSQSVMVNLALNLVSEGLRSSLWLQFKPHHIAAGAAYLAAKFLHMDLTGYQHIWQEFQTTPVIIQDVAQQLMELF
ncbi:Cyclin family protein [Euphorbia peplus]|nr:Cyclin family protein [Euphorbia peplus]